MTSEEKNRLYKPIQQELADVEEYIEKLITTENGFVAKNVPYILRAGGKRLRPALLLLAAKICNSTNGERAMKLATVIELIHTASLIHDDVIDNDILRRGLPTLNTQVGDKFSVILGDYIYSMVFMTLAEINDMDSIKYIAKTTSQMARGDLVQMQEQYNLELSEERYLQINSDKTASLISCACRIGALCGDARNGEVDILTRYGQNLGMAFQITDDLLDITAEESSFGKPLGSDIREGKMTLPLIRTLGEADKRDKEWIRTLITSHCVDDSALHVVREMTNHYNAIEYSKNKALEYSQACKDACRELEESALRNTLVDFADFAVERVS